MVRVITQDTFDAVVKENIEVFEMSPEEAVKEAKEQFLAQGVNLNNIVIPDDGSEPLVLKSLKELKNSLEQVEENGKFEEILANCDIVGEECLKGLPERILATKNEGYEILLQVFNTNDLKAQISAIKSLTSLLDGNPDPLEEEGFKILLCGLNSEDSDLRSATLECILNCCVRHEHNRQNFIRNGILNHLDKALNQPTAKEAGDVVRVVRIWQALVQDDDVRVPFGQAHENAREIVENHQALEKLTTAINESSTTKDMSLFLSCLSSLTVRNEYCQAVVDSGGLKCLINLLIDPDQSKEIVRESLKMMKTLAGNDNVKNSIQNSDGVPVIVNAISKNLSVKSICGAGCGVISAICLRTPGNAKQVMESGGAQLLTQILKTHMDTPPVLISACNAIRNIASRSKDLVPEFTDLDIENLLHQVKTLHSTGKVEESVKSALRDLGLKVELKEVWTGGAVKQE